MRLRILLDECLPKDLRASLSPHKCTSVVDFGYLPGRKKERLLAFGDGIFDVHYVQPSRRGASEALRYRTAVVISRQNRIAYRILGYLAPRYLLL
jgi:hypothetical protein